MKFKLTLEKIIDEFFEMWIKQTLECILMQKSCQLYQVIWKIFQNRKFNLNWKKFAERKLNFDS